MNASKAVPAPDQDSGVCAVCIMTRCWVESNIWSVTHTQDFRFADHSMLWVSEISVLVGYGLSLWEYPF